MEKRAKSEQFRKSRNNYFQRGFDIGVKSEAKIYVLIERNDKFYRFMNTERPFWSSQAELDRKMAMSKTAADYQARPQPKRKAAAPAAAHGPTYAVAMLDCQRTPDGWEKILSLVE